MILSVPLLSEINIAEKLATTILAFQQYERAHLNLAVVFMA